MLEEISIVQINNETQDAVFQLNLDVITVNIPLANSSDQSFDDFPLDFFTGYTKSGRNSNAIGH